MGWNYNWASLCAYIKMSCVDLFIFTGTVTLFNRWWNKSGLLEDEGLLGVILHRHPFHKKHHFSVRKEWPLGGHKARMSQYIRVDCILEFLALFRWAPESLCFFFCGRLSGAVNSVVDAGTDSFGSTRAGGKDGNTISTFTSFLTSFAESSILLRKLPGSGQFQDKAGKWC